MAHAAPDDTFRAMAEVVSPSTHAVVCVHHRRIAGQSVPADRAHEYVLVAV